MKNVTMFSQALQTVSRNLC